MEIKLGQLSKNRVKQNIEFLETEETRNNDIAIIGVACRFAQSDSQDEYWDAIANGVDCIRTLPEERKRINKPFLKYSPNYSESDEYCEGGFLNDVDKFDNEFFHVSPIEAKIMSPQQREFLQIAWSAIEDAGYGGNKLAGSNTGVFLGYTTDFGLNYKEYVDVLNKDLEALAVAGNLNSIVASRIAYLLDLKGPSVLVDTACSSSLVAVHTACESILRGECNTALAGSVKLDLLPLSTIAKKEIEIGITSKEGRTRTFDNSSNGTGAGEGVAAVLLKPLKDALQDRDQIYAVIKGSAVNQDGKSVNLTSPNPLAQENVIMKAWKNANIDPKTVSYIEAHGTGTRLGDPIEITGINHAFRHFVDKQQFCGVGSVKTNIGHLDCAAGMAALVKSVLALKYKMLPPSIHFEFPNQKINFEESAVYVNDVLRPWTPQYYPRRCGVSAFGLSGTNCHIVLEEAPERVAVTYTEPAIRIATFSSKTTDGLMESLWKMGTYMKKHADLSIDDICYTLNTGRGQYEHRLVFLFETKEQFQDKIDGILLKGWDAFVEEDVYYGKCQIVSTEQKKHNDGEMTEWEKNQISNQVNQQIVEVLARGEKYEKDWLREICKQYCHGAEVSWEPFYAESHYRKVSIPTYSYARNSFWVEPADDIDEKNTLVDTVEHPLFSSCLAQSFDRITYESYWNPKKDWVLYDHKVVTKYVVPGTTYLEMARYVLETHYQPKEIRLFNVFFLRPLALSEDESVKVQTIINTNEDDISFTIVSQKIGEKDWTVHVEGKANLIYQKDQSSLDLEQLQSKMSVGTIEEYPYEGDEKIETGERWKCVEKVWKEDAIYLIKMGLRDEFHKEAKQYGMHPALLDEAANALLRTIGEGLYLPYSYRSIVVKDNLPPVIYSYVKEKSKKTEYALFDVTLTDQMGNVIVVINDYMIRKINSQDISRNISGQTFLQKFIWKESIQRQVDLGEENAFTVLLGAGEKNQEIAQYLKEKGCEIHNLPDSEEGFTKILQSMDLKVEQKVLYLLPQFYQSDKKDDFAYRLEQSLYGVQNFVMALNRSDLSAKLELVVAGYEGESVQDNENIVPEYAAVYSYVEGIRFEIPKLSCQCIDIDEHLNPEDLYWEMNQNRSKNTNQISNQIVLSAYRQGRKFVRRLVPCQMDALASSDITIEEKQTYIITGGTGGLGLECAKFLASKQQVRLILVSRNGLKSDLRKQKMIEEIEALGTEVIVKCGDISNLEFLRMLFADIQSQYGSIRGVFHLAGVAGNGFIRNKTLEQIDEVLLPKMQGAWNIEQLYEEFQLEFVVFFSSISAIIAEAGQVDYAAANAYLDGFAQYGKRKGRNYIAINWPAWKETGMAVQYNVDFEEQIIEPILTKDGFAVLEMILEKKVENVIVGKFSLDKYIEQEVNLFEVSPTFIKNQNMLSTKKEKDYTGTVTLEGKESYSAYERKIGNVIGKVLGIDRINVFEEFVEIGLNSIISVKVELELENEGFHMSINDLFEFNSVKLLAEHFEGNENGKDEKEPIEKEKEAMLELVPFNDVFYVSCVHNVLIPVLSLYQENLYQLMSKIFYVYTYDADIPFDDNLLERISDISVKELLEITGSITTIIKHVSEKASEWELNDIDEYAVKDMRCYMGVISSSEEKDLSCVMDDIKTALEKEHPVMTLVDCFYNSKRADTYQIEHWMHAILVIGYNDKKEEFYVLEHSFKEVMNYKIRTISYKDFVDSYEGYLINYQNETELPGFYEFDVEHTPKNLNVMSKDEAKAEYISFMKRHTTELQESLTHLQELIQKIKEMIADKETLEENVEDLILILGSCVSRRQIDYFNANTIFDGESEFVPVLDSIIKKWTYIRKILIRQNAKKDLIHIDDAKLEEMLDSIYQEEVSWVQHWK